MAGHQTQRLDRMTVIFREIPEIAWTEIDNFSLALGVYHRHLAMPLDDIGPFRRIVPMHFACAACVDEEMRAGDIGGDRKPARGDFASPAARRRLDRALVQRNRKD